MCLAVERRAKGFANERDLNIYTPPLVSRRQASFALVVVVVEVRKLVSCPAERCIALMVLLTVASDFDVKSDRCYGSCVPLRSGEG